MSFILAENSIPKLQGPAQVRVSRNEPITVVVAATDDDGDEVMFTLADNDDGRRSIDPATGVINATFDAANSSSVRSVSLMLCLIPSARLL